MFAYCNNSPVSCFDSEGTQPVQNKMLMSNDGGGYDPEDDSDDVGAFESFAKGVINKEYSGTFFAGTNLSFAAGLGLSVSFGIVVDMQANVGILISISPSAGTVSVGAGSIFTITGSPNIFALEGTGFQVGGSAGEMVVVGGEYCMIPDKKTGELYHGGSLLLGAGFTAIGAELHAEMGKTWVFGTNLLDFFDKVFGGN